MKKFEKWQEKRELKTIGYLSNLGAYKAGEKKGWRAALEWVLSEYSVDINEAYKHFPHIRRELKDENQNLLHN